MSKICLEYKGSPKLGKKIIESLISLVHEENGDIISINCEREREIEMFPVAPLLELQGIHGIRGR